MEGRFQKGNATHVRSIFSCVFSRTFKEDAKVLNLPSISEETSVLEKYSVVVVEYMSSFVENLPT